MRRTLLVCSWLVACSHPEAQPEVATGREAPASEAEDVTMPPAPPAPPTRLLATRGRARVELEAGGGILVDVNAPPPPPGSTPARHATLHGSCAGDPSGCSEAGTVVRSAATLDDVRVGLEALGFTVTLSP